MNRVFLGNPELINQWLKELHNLKEKHMSVVVLGLWYSGLQDTKSQVSALLDEYPKLKPEFSFINQGSPMTVEQIPFEQVGVLDIVEAGGYGDSEYPNWAIGSLITHDDDFGVSIKIGEGVISKAKIDIDSGNEVRVWLNASVKDYGVYTFPVTRIESL
jgi:hypothetical protein